MHVAMHVGSADLLEAVSLYVERPHIGPKIWLVRHAR